MSPWAKLDDNFHSHAKTLAAGLEANGFYCRALSYCANHMTDGFVPDSFVALHLRGKVRNRVLERLLTVGLLEKVNGGFHIPDWLDYNPSKADLARLKADRSAAGRRGAASKWGDKSHSKSDGKPMASARQLPDTEKCPIPSHTKNTPLPPGFEEWLAHNQQVTGNTPPRESTQAFRDIAQAFAARRKDYSLEDLKLANVGAQADDHRRDNGYTTADSVLRPTKVYGLIEKGRRAAKQNRPPKPAEADLRCRGCGEPIDVFRFRNRSRLCQGCEDREAEAA
jgi:hypothetical protein